MEKEQNAIWNGYNVWSPTTQVQDGGSVNESGEYLAGCGRNLIVIR